MPGGRPKSRARPQRSKRQADRTGSTSSGVGTRSSGDTEPAGSPCARGVEARQYSSGPRDWQRMSGALEQLPVRPQYLRAVIHERGADAPRSDSVKTIASQAAKRHTPAGEAMTTAAPSTQPPQTPGSGGHNRGVLIAVIGAIAAIVAAAIAIVPAMTNTSPGPDHPTSVPTSPEKLHWQPTCSSAIRSSLDATPPQRGQGDDLRASARGDGTFDLVAGTNARVAVRPPKSPMERGTASSWWLPAGRPMSKCCPGCSCVS